MASTFFLELGSSAAKIAYSLLADALGLSTRPLALIYVALPRSLSMLGTVLDAGLLYGLLSTVSVGLIMLSIGALVSFRFPDGFVRFVVGLYAADGVAQLPIMIWPAAKEIWHYPMSHTGMLVTLLQLRIGLAFAIGITSPPDDGIDKRLQLLSVAIPLRYMSLVLVESTSPSAYVLYSVGVVLMIFVLTPYCFWKMLGKGLHKVAEMAKYILSFVYIALAYVCPKIQECLCAILQHPFLVGIYHMIVLPIWEFVSPWFLPFAMLALVRSGIMSLMDMDMKRQLTSWPDGSLSVIFRMFGLATAIASLLIMALHIAVRKCTQDQPDPLGWSLLTILLTALARTISFPVWLVCRMWEPVLRYVLRPLSALLLDMCGRLASFACYMPALSIFCIILANVLLIINISHVTSFIWTIFLPVLGLITAVAKAAQNVPSAVATGAPTDSVLAIVFIMAIQIGAYHAIACVLEAVRLVRGERTGHVLSLDELNDLAVTMSDPRQCARCGFGPVDHRGCSDLRSHHMEVSVRGGSRSSVSNACPRCDWFTGNLHDWPPWDGDLQTVRGRAMFRQRVWSEVVVVVRASSKAFLFPYGLLLLGNWLHLPPSPSAFLAFSYLVPWAAENWKIADSINSPRAYRTLRRDHIPLRALPGGDDDADCGAGDTQPIMPEITQSQALTNILAGNPSSVFLARGDICSVCLEPFSAKAAEAVNTGEPVIETCQQLRTLNPPVVVLRCGHPLHVECAEAAVSAGGARHVRCPLCREPVTLSGDASAVMFS